MNSLRGRFWYSSTWRVDLRLQPHRGEREVGQVAAARLRAPGCSAGAAGAAPRRHAALRFARLRRAARAAAPRARCTRRCASARSLPGLARLGHRQRRLRAAVLVDVAAAVEVGLRERLGSSGRSRVFALTSTTSSGWLGDFAAQRVRETRNAATAAPRAATTRRARTAAPSTRSLRRRQPSRQVHSHVSPTSLSYFRLFDQYPLLYPSPPRSFCQGFAIDAARACARSDRPAATSSRTRVPGGKRRQRGHPRHQRQRRRSAPDSRAAPGVDRLRRLPAAASAGTSSSPSRAGARRSAA